MAFTQASLPFLLLNHQDRTKGVSIGLAGLGLMTVRAQIQAITVCSVPPGAVTFGYR